jgi:drug/metabolite transporter (DMT)-like permease
MERRRAIWLALLVTFLWSTSWVLIKLGLRQSMPPLSFAGLRYMLAFLCLVPFVAFNREQRAQLRRLERGDWAWLAALGLVFYALTQGAQYLSLAYLPAALVSMLLNLTPVLVGMGGLLFLGERPAVLQWLGLLLTVAGVLIYFQAVELPAGQWFGLGVAVLGVIANAASSVMGRRVNRSQKLPALLVTFVSMGIGAAILMLVGGLTQGFGKLEWSHWLIISWLALINTALAFTLWNYSLRVLSAVESSIINCLMLPQIAILAYVFLQETLTFREISGLGLVVLGVILVQMRGQYSVSWRLR